MQKGKKKMLCAAAAVCAAAVVCIAVYMLLPGRENNSSHWVWKGKADIQGLEEERRETLYVGVSSAVSGIHPYTQMDETMEFLKKLVYEPLIREKADGELAYGNAEEIVFEENGKKAIVQLNSKKSFADGTMLTADNVIESYRWFMENSTAYDSTVGRLEKMEKRGEVEVEFTFARADVKNLELLEMPLIYQADKDSEYGETCLGTGEYRIVSIEPYSGVILEKREPAEGIEETMDWKRVVIEQMDYSQLEEKLKAGETDLFLSDKSTIAEIVKAGGTYSLYAKESETGHWIVGKQEEEVAAAIAGICRQTESMQEDLGDEIYSGGIVSAYMKGKRYDSLVKTGSTKGLGNVSILCGYDSVSREIAGRLEQALEEKGILLSGNNTEEEPSPGQEFAEDLMVCYGDYRELAAKEETEAFYRELGTQDAVNFNQVLEEYLTGTGRIIPVSRDTIWYAVLEGRDAQKLLE